MTEISKPAKEAWADLLRMIATSMARTPDEVAAKVIEGAEIIQRAIDESHVILRAGFETALACGDSQRERIKGLKAALEATGNAMNALGIKELEHQFAVAREDVERLDAAQKSKWDIHWSHSAIKKNRVAFIGNLHTTKCKGTIRETIDAARKESDGA